MKKCPNCQKEFPDSMRFCQTDGTPLGDPVQESQPEDPLKTTVVRQEDIASAIPPSDPFKTMVANSTDPGESGDLLQLPDEEFDPLKTMVATPIRQEPPILEEPRPATPKFEDIKQEIKSESSPAFGGFSQPSEPLPEAPKDYSGDPTVLQPEPPKFNEPSLNPPNFGDSTPKDEDDLPQTIMQNQWDNAPRFGQSPFAKPGDSPQSSPFDQPKTSFDEPPTPFGQSSSSSSSSSPFDQQQQYDAPNESNYNPPPAVSFDKQPSSFEPQNQTYEQPPANQFGTGQSQFDQMNQGFGNQNQQVQQNDWNPPPTPEQGWGDQGLGANTPFQPPVVGAGKSQTLAVVSIITGGLSVLFLGGLIIPLVNLACMFLAPALGLTGIITGFLGRSRATRSPEQYGGAGLALGGIITGALSILAIVGLFVLVVVLGASGYFGR